ncbi:sensor histidine kinase [Pseudaestuariivita atlantica]|uniref:histidine kinase n=1 Tax=Pseudaestuariivita atlantica TaxID=1317121 RepID=A0A0L1JUE0_9RHOB|nr:sensor histidine kinase [Pseudaestuariivita atlantica]KNG95008.1 sodium:solute symporter [Pseudaestuariivita atlantica]
MTAVNLLVLVSLAYVMVLFLVAWAAERSAARGRGAWVRAPVVYTLSLSVYCTAWTFYGAVGYAARSGLEFLTIYLGPTLVMLGWWLVLRKLVTIGRRQNITSIADLISSRFGKSNTLAVGVTLLAVIATTPYIALQLQSIALSFGAFIAHGSGPASEPVDATRVAFWSALGLAIFTIVFGTRRLNVHERHHGVVLAIAVEAVVKLFALLAVGVFVVWGLSGGVAETMARIDASAIGRWEMQGSRWVGLTFLSAAAFLCLPRMFHVLVVENDDSRFLRAASWAFPLYLMLMSLFVVPIAVVGLDLLPAGSNPDLFVLTLPLTQGREGLAILAFIGGFSSATSMVIVATIALSIMVSNHVVMPIFLRATGTGAQVSGDVRAVVLLSRRAAIAGVVALGYIYYALSGGGEALAKIGLISFTGVVQVLPAMLGGLFWRGANGRGAVAGLAAGFIVWTVTLFLPSFGPGVVYSAETLANGLFGQGWLRPQALFGIDGLDPLLHGLFWSLVLNVGALVAVSLVTFPRPLERLQGAHFVNVFQQGGGRVERSTGAAQSEDLMIMAQRILGPDEALTLFRQAAEDQGLGGYLPEPDAEFLERLERALAGSVGGATAHAMVTQITGGASVSVADLMAVADETAQIMEYSSRLEAQSEELTRTARQLRRANRKLTRLSVQKDAFLSQISHELRTPMTSIRAFSDIIRAGGDMPEADRVRFAGIIHDEAERLSRLLDDLLDLSVLENGQVTLNLREGQLATLLDQAVATAATSEDGARLAIVTDVGEIALTTDLDRLGQVFINLIANARKYCDAAEPRLVINARLIGGRVIVDFTDNGQGIAPEMQDVMFEKFSRVGDQNAGGAGLGLAICRQIMTRLGGSIEYVPGRDGAVFRVILPQQAEAQAA